MPSPHLDSVPVERYDVAGSCARNDHRCRRRWFRLLQSLWLSVTPVRAAVESVGVRGDETVRDDPPLRSRADNRIGRAHVPVVWTDIRYSNVTKLHALR